MRDPWHEAQRLLDEPAAFAPYQRWLERQPEPEDDYLFAESRARFEVEAGDVLRVPRDLSLTPRSVGLELRSAALGGSVCLPALEAKAVLRVLAHIDGTRTLDELRARAGSDRPLLEQVVQLGFGSWLFAPGAVLELESELSGVELVRFVGAPYELVRPYWRNMAAVRRLARTSLELARDPLTATRWLRTLHVITLVGDDQRTFYRPASRTAARDSQPGQLYTAVGQRVTREGGTLLLSGPRVGVGLPGGATYQRLVYARAGDLDALLPERSLRDAGGLDWGTLVTGRAPTETADAPWFCPPRPLLPEHFSELFGELDAALGLVEQGAPGEVAVRLARFHWRFVRLHPFRCANQCLAMNIVNLVLTRSHGAGMPHLLLDTMALRLNEPAYTRVFALAAQTHARGLESSAARWAWLRQQKLQTYALIAQVQQAPDADSALRLLEEHPEAARAALIAGM